MTFWETIDSIRNTCNDCDDINKEIWDIQKSIDDDTLSDEDIGFYNHKIVMRKQLLKQNILVIKYLSDKLSV